MPVVHHPVDGRPVPVAVAQAVHVQVERVNLFRKAIPNVLYFVLKFEYLRLELDLLTVRHALASFERRLALHRGLKVGEAVADRRVARGYVHPLEK